LKFSNVNQGDQMLTLGKFEWQANEFIVHT